MKAAKNQQTYFHSIFRSSWRVVSSHHAVYGFICLAHSFHRTSRRSRRHSYPVNRHKTRRKLVLYRVYKNCNRTLECSEALIISHRNNSFTFRKTRLLGTNQIKNCRSKWHFSPLRISLKIC